MTEEYTFDKANIVDKNYILVGATPFKMNTGTTTTTFTSLYMIGTYRTAKEAYDAFEKNYYDCGGLLHIFELEGNESTLTGLAESICLFKLERDEAIKRKNELIVKYEKLREEFQKLKGEKDVS